MSGRLNSRQQQAVNYIDGPLLVLAGAGSGKTRVITQKISFLIKQCGISANNIAAVTFTNKAAKEMKQRVAQKLTKKESRGLQISTFHTLGLKILRAEYLALGYKKDLSIYDAHDCMMLLKELGSALKLDEGDLKKIQTKISNWKNDLIYPEFVQSSEDDPLSRHAVHLYAAYSRYLKSCNAVDFDDLILLPVMLFQQHADCLERWQNRMRYILVDEYQDTNTSQYNLIQLLVGTRAALTVVGDDDQSIYAWRGAQAENLAKLKDDFPRLKVIMLEQNYRSTGCILQAANGLIENNPHVFVKKLWCEIGFGETIKIIETRNEEHEAERVVGELLQHKFQHGTKFRDYAILYRGNHQSRPLERQLREHQISYRVTGGTSFFSHTEVKDIIGYLRLIANPEDNAAFIRVVNTPRRGIGSATLEKLMGYAEQRQVSFYEACSELGLAQILSERSLKPLLHFSQWLSTFSRNAESSEIVKMLHELINDIEYSDWLLETSNDARAAERRMENITELIDWISNIIESNNSELTLSGIVSHMQLMDILDRQEQEQDNDDVSLMTLHGSKGLEFPYVYIVGVEEEMLPHRSSLEDGNLQEERRLAYVGITRAQKNLTITYAAKRKRAGEMEDCEPSRFLGELPAETINWKRLNDKVDPEVRQQTGKAHFANLRDMLGDPV